LCDNGTRKVIDLRVETRSMENDKAKSAGAVDPRRRRVPPPTIDLEATDVSLPSDSGHAAAPDSVPSDSPPGAAAAVESPSVETIASAPMDDPPPANPPPAEPPAAGAPPGPSGPAWFVPNRSQAVAGALGAVLALIVATGLWALLGPGGDQPGDIDARLTRMEAQLGALSHAAPTPADTKALDDLNGRLGRIESTLTDRLAELNRRGDDTMASARLARERADTAAKSLADVAQQLAQLNAERARAPAVERSDLDTLATRLASLEAATKGIGDQLARITNAAAAGNTRQAVLAIALNTAVERGAPYGRELAAIDPANAGSATLAALRPFAETGVPSQAVLARELAAVMPAALKAADAPPPGGGFLDRLQANAERLVRIRPADQQQQGDEPSAILARVDAKAARGDIAGVLAEAAKLPTTVRAPLEPWIRRAEAREAAVAAAAALAARSLDVIRRPPQQGASDR
jgi:hypothetical protein